MDKLFQILVKVILFLENSNNFKVIKYSVSIKLLKLNFRAPQLSTYKLIFLEILKEVLFVL